MSESIPPGRSVLELGAAALVGLAVGLAAGLAAGVMIGRLMSGGEPAAPAKPVADAPDPRAEITQLSESVAEL
ncbi:MAG: amidohydrolase family protein, partial [Planctomycetota bacterium]